MEGKRRGRPKGAKTLDVEVVEVEQTTCPKCGSTQRSPFIGTPRHVETSGDHDGLTYSSVTFRRCKCLKCGQVRSEKTFNYL
jgi:hypothetical protein